MAPIPAARRVKSVSPSELPDASSQGQFNFPTLNRRQFDTIDMRRDWTLHSEYEQQVDCALDELDEEEEEEDESEVHDSFDDDIEENDQFAETHYRAGKFIQVYL